MAAWLAIVSLPWLGVKYVPVAAVLALVCLVRLWRDERTRAALLLVVAFAAAGAAYLVGHRLIYGGWTVYAAGDHFVSGGELSVVGHEPNYLGRSQRLVGLLLDRSFGLAAWMPGYLLAAPAFAALLRRRPHGSTLVLAAPLAAGWATATWVALTMHGWWWPGRQTVVVLPCVVLMVAWWLAQRRPANHGAAAVQRRLWLRVPLAAGVVRRLSRSRSVGLANGAVLLMVSAAFGAVAWLWLVVEAWGRHRTLIVDFDTTSNPLYQAWRLMLPDYRDPGAGDWLRHTAWLVALAALAIGGWRSKTSERDEPPAPSADDRAVTAEPHGDAGVEPASAPSSAASTSSKSSVPETRRRPTHVPA